MSKDFIAPSAPRKSSILPSIAVGGGAFVIGVGLTFGYVQWQSQQQKLAALSDMVTQMQQGQVAPAQDVTRNASPDLTAVTNPAAPVSAAVELSNAVAASVQDAAPEPAAPLSTADQVSALAQIAALPEVTTLSRQTPYPDVNQTDRLEVLSIISAGIEDLVMAVVEGNYEIHTNYEDEDFSGRIHFSFAGDKGDQTDLEQFLAAAAEAGIVAFSNSVVDSNGRVNGHILLFDLVERALENGTLEEQAAVAKMQQEAVDLLREDVTVGEVLTPQGEQYYVVEAGDSLAYIALQFYGNTNGFQRIYEANRDSLSSPERIRTGQRLLIPAAG